VNANEDQRDPVNAGGASSASSVAERFRQTAVISEITVPKNMPEMKPKTAKTAGFIIVADIF
jgi:hypothetical protein